MTSANRFPDDHGDRAFTARTGIGRAPASPAWDGKPALPPSVWPNLPLCTDDHGARAGKGLIERVVFDSRDYPEAERATAYQLLIGGPAQVTPLAEPFRVHAVFYSLGELRVCLFDNVPHRFERSRAKLAFDNIDHICIQHLVRGSAVGTFDGVPFEADEGSVYGIDFARPATIEEQGPMRLVLLGIKRDVAARALPSLDLLHGLVLPFEAAAPFLRPLYGIVQNLETMTAAEARPAAAELLARFASCVDLGTAGSDDASADRWAGKRRQANAFIEAHLSDRRLTPDRVADGLRVSRSLLFAAFRDQGGVERAIIDRRLDRARFHLLAAGARPSVGQVAELCGFSSPEHLTRQFRVKFGVTPSRFGRTEDQPD